MKLKGGHLSVGLVGVLVSFVLGVILGGIPGYYGGTADMGLRPARPAALRSREVATISQRTVHQGVADTCTRRRKMTEAYPNGS